MNEGGFFSRIVAGILVVVAGSGLAPAGDDESVAELVTRVGRARWTHDNSVRLLVNPVEAWQARVELANNARHHILISLFSWHNDEYGKDYRRILIGALERQKAAGGDLTLRVLADASALFQFSRAFSTLERQGAKVRGFNRSSWGLTPVYDGRMHDKMFIADGRSAIVSGRNIADDYFNPRRWWLDLGVRLEGPAVDDLQMIFLKSWEFTEFNRKAGRFLMPQEELVKELRVFWQTGRFPNGKSPLERFVTPEYFPVRTEPAGTIPVAILYDNPFIRRRAATTDLVIALAGKASDRIDIMTPFPNFDPTLTDALAAAAGRGVAVRLFVNDREAAIRAGPFLLAGYPTLIRLIEAGAEVWAWRANDASLRQMEEGGCAPEIMPPIAIHGKMVLVDDDLSIIHSSNFNIRSTYYNTEAGVAVLDRELNRELTELLAGLIEFRDGPKQCVGGSGIEDIPDLMHLLGPDDLPRMREELGGKQPFLDAWGVTW